MVNPQSWDEIKASLKLDTKVTGVVTRHFPFGIFVDIPGIKFVDLVEIISFRDRGIMTPS